MVFDQWKEQTKQFLGTKNVTVHLHGSNNTIRYIYIYICIYIYCVCTELFQLADWGLHSTTGSIRDKMAVSSVRDSDISADQ